VTPASGPLPPLKIGVLVTDTDTYQRAAGVGVSQTALERDGLHALINGINAAGGVAGRKLVAVDATFNFLASSFDSEFQAACDTFTVDNHVGAVIYDDVTYSQLFNDCLEKAGVPQFNMGQTGSSVGDITDLQNHPGLISVDTVTLDRRIRSILEGSLRFGYLHAGSKLGVVVEACPYAERAYDRTFLPIVKKAKITVLREDVNCGTGSGDEGTGIAAVQSDVLRWRSEGVDSIMLVTLYEKGTKYYIVQAAEAQHWTPNYLMFHQEAEPGVMAAYPADQLNNMYGFGGLPLEEVTHPPAPAPAQARVRRACLALLRSHGIDTVQVYNQWTDYMMCDAVWLLQRALTISGGLGGTAHLVPAAERIGDGFISAMTFDGVTRLGPGHHDGMVTTAVSVWSDACACFVYKTRPEVLP
jgi:hypothetical protein